MTNDKVTVNGQVKVKGEDEVDNCNWEKETQSVSAALQSEIVLIVAVDHASAIPPNALHSSFEYCIMLTNKQFCLLYSMVNLSSKFSNYINIEHMFNFTELYNLFQCSAAL